MVSTGIIIVAVHGLKLESRNLGDLSACLRARTGRDETSLQVGCLQTGRSIIGYGLA
ncbi:MAG: hypothetical protein JRD93_15610 [Deltaproteobacteria bacterium]|nr:hypothetical protein [Deltaproteobacteria bacterium]MBW2663365.1 hypothetical protein [Deltaproteobacteria bacterium]